VVWLAAPVHADAKKADDGAFEINPTENMPAFAGNEIIKAKRIDKYLCIIFPPWC
jgi:hypothetical protein